VGEITVSVVGSKNPNWFDTHQIPKHAAYAIPDEAATRLMTASLAVRPDERSRPEKRRQPVASCEIATRCDRRP